MFSRQKNAQKESIGGGGISWSVLQSTHVTARRVFFFKTMDNIRVSLCMEIQKQAHQLTNLARLHLIVGGARVHAH